MPENFDTSIIETDEGQLGAVIIQFETIEDSFEKAIVRYDIPYADGADLEDMGQKAHVIRFRCWFWDDAEQETYGTHTLLITELNGKDLIDFVHPKYGLLQGKVESIIIQHDDRIRTACIDITFIEQMRRSLDVAPAQSVQAAVEEAYQKAQEQQESLLMQALATILPAEDLAAVSTALDAGQGLLTQMQGFTSTTRAAVAEVEKYLSAAEATANEVVSPVNSLQATLTYGQALPGRILGSLSGVLERTARLYDSLWNYPSQFINKLNLAFSDLEGSYQDLADGATSPAGQSAGSVMRDHLSLACASRLALEAAALYAEDDRAAKNAEESDVEVMTINELEATLAVVRTRLAAAVTIARDVDSLKAMSAALLTQVNHVRLQREKMITVVLDNPIPLHLACLVHGLPYADAERILKVNNIRNPNFTSGEIKVYAT